MIKIKPSCENLIIILTSGKRAVMDGEMPGLRIAKAIAESEKILQRGNGIKQLLRATWQVLQLCACKFTTTIFGNL